MISLQMGDFCLWGTNGHMGDSYNLYLPGTGTHLNIALKRNICTKFPRQSLKIPTWNLSAPNLVLRTKGKMQNNLTYKEQFNNRICKKKKKNLYDLYHFW